MRNRMFLALALLVVATAANAQGKKIPPPEELKKLDFMLGEWKGEAEVMGREGKQIVLQTETVRTELDGGIIVVRGRGFARKEDGTAGDLVHDAFGVISWDREKKQYRFDPWVSGGMRAETTFQAVDRGFDWTMKTPQGGTVRYTMRVKDNGQWNEVGEFSMDGAKWMKFIDMTLTKVK